ncbi:BlaI/MecI/CopY family transcriptional regulator [uncultured Paludibaculum sp.]|uniref:BlaI/MecI/CopY family transcriptional regulator n=1 Tax=uncultured Paludibaculum sp. TaxID=1765020 RepID=UPI002AAB1B0D|nr:BlaI/MecI/CopY family transcriptional regulator [uncultured Paludibaculum sp.]
MQRRRTAREIPPPLELQCLNALWSLGEANVQAVRDLLAPSRQLAYTTVMTMLDRLTRKQVLSRRKNGRSFVYTPLISKDEVRRLAVNELVDSLFEGSESGLRGYLNGGAQASKIEAEAHTAARVSVPPTEPDEPQALDAALL